jgi:hypothetical protein
VEPHLCSDGERNQGDGSCGAPDRCADGFAEVRIGETATCSAWRRNDELPSPLTVVRFAHTDTTLFATCGTNATTTVPPKGALANTDGEQVTGDWVALPEKTAHLCAPVVVGRKLYVFGGHQFDAERSIRIAPSMVALLGGFEVPQAFGPSDVELVTPRTQAAAVVADGAVWIFGGSEATGALLRTVERAEILADDRLAPFAIVGQLRAGHVHATVTAIGAERFVITATTALNGEPLVEVWSPGPGRLGDEPVNRNIALPRTDGLEGCQVMIPGPRQVIGLGMTNAAMRTTTGIIPLDDIDRGEPLSDGQPPNSTRWQRSGRLPMPGAPFTCAAIGSVVLMLGQGSEPSNQLWSANAAALVASKEGR